MINVIKNIVSGKKQEYGTFGILYNDSFPESSVQSYYTTVGTNTVYNQTANELDINRTTGTDLTEYIYRNDNHSILEKFILKCRYTVPIINASSHGIAIGQQGSIVSKSNIAGLRTDTGSLGKLVIYKDNDFSTPVYTSTLSLTINANDVLEIEINFNVSNFTATARNITTGFEITHTISNAIIYPTTDLSRSGKAGYYAIYPISGNVNVTLFSCESTETTNADYCVVGDSITERYAATSLANSYQGRLKSALGGRWVTFAGGGNYTTEILNSIDQIIRLNPLNVILFISTNDFANGSRSLVDVQTDYSSIVSQLENAGINVILCENIPRTGQDFTTWNSWLSSNFTNKLIQWYDVMGNPQGSTTINSAYYVDTVHPNNDGFEQMANIALTEILN